MWGIGLGARNFPLNLSLAIYLILLLLSTSASLSSAGENHLLKLSDFLDSLYLYYFLNYKTIIGSQWENSLSGPAVYNVTKRCPLLIPLFIPLFHFSRKTTVVFPRPQSMLCWIKRLGRSNKHGLLLWFLFQFPPSPFIFVEMDLNRDNQ